MKKAHQIVKICIDITRDDPANPIYIASNEELGVFVKGPSFRDMLTELRAVLALRLKGITPSLQFYSSDSVQNTGSGMVPGTTLGHQTGRETRIN